MCSLNCGAYVKASNTIAITVQCATRDATKDDVPCRGSGCSVNREIVREDLIRRMNPSLVGCLLLLYIQSGFSNGLCVAPPDTLSKSKGVTCGGMVCNRKSHG